MAYSLFITLREGVEAALIIAIVLSYLGRVGQRRYVRHVWLGAALALLGSLVAGVTLQLLAVELSGAALEALEGSAMFLAVGVLTWMLFWMKRQAATLGRHLRAQVDEAMRSGSALALALLSFVAVSREGLETVLFLFAGASAAPSASLYWLGAWVGLLGAAAAGYVIYTGSARLPLGAFFDITGVILILLAAGLVSNGLMEFQEMGLIPSLGPHVWDTYQLIADNSRPGRLLNAILGYQSSPFLGQVVAYVGYLSTALPLFFLGRGKLAQHAGQAAPLS